MSSSPTPKLYRSVSALSRTQNARFKEKKTGPKPKRLEDIIAILSRVETQEAKLIDLLFEGKTYEASQLKINLGSLKSQFKNSCHGIIASLHHEDYKELNESMVKELDKHFSYWNEMFSKVKEKADESLKKLVTDQSKDRELLTDIQHKVHSLMPKCMKEIVENQQIEYQLINMQEHKDAVFVRRKNDQLREKMVKDTHVNRKIRINKEKAMFKNVQKDERALLLGNIQEGLRKLSAKRRNEFSLLWQKYNKVCRTVDNLHHKEASRLRYLESRRIENPIRHKLQPRLKIRNPADPSLTMGVTNGNTLKQIYGKEAAEGRAKSALRAREGIKGEERVHERLYGQAVNFTAKDVELYI